MDGEGGNDFDYLNDDEDYEEDYEDYEESGEKVRNLNWGNKENSAASAKNGKRGEDSQPCSFLRKKAE